MERSALVAGSGPNGLAAAITLAQTGLRVRVHEASDGGGGAVRTLPLTLPGFKHDIGAAVFPLGFASPFFRTLPLEQHGLEWIHPTVPLAHALDSGHAVFLRSMVVDTARDLGRDANTWRRIFSPLVDRWHQLLEEILQPLIHVPRHPFTLTRFGSLALLPSTTFAELFFSEERTRALFLGLAAHSNLPLDSPGTAGMALTLAVAAQAGGWPIVRGGAQSLTDSLCGVLHSLGGTLQTNTRVTHLPVDELCVLDTSPREAAKMLGRPLRNLTTGPGNFKVDWALSAPIPWKNPSCALAGTVHVGGTSAEIEDAEKAPHQNRVADKPFILLSQPSLFDSSRAPEGRHTAWAYCHVPAGSAASALQQIEAQIERFAPGFHDVVLARATRTPNQFEHWNSNMIGGDNTGGLLTLSQTFFRLPYKTPQKNVFLCSSSTAPGGGVHGMCGHLAALNALKTIENLRQRVPLS